MIESNKERQAPKTIELAEQSHLVRYIFALKFTKPSYVVLDVPCGTGYGSALLAQKSKFVYGIDNSDIAIKRAKELFKKENTEYIIADMYKMSFLRDKSINLIISFEGIEHISNPQQFLLEAKRILKDNGKLVISTPRKPHGSPFHIIEYSLEEYKKLLSKEFIIEKMFGQIYTDIFDMSKREEDPEKYHRFNFIAVCKK